MAADICLTEISDMKKFLVKELHREMTEDNFSSLDTQETGEVIDMIKDLAAAERYCAQACYYNTVTEAMKDSSDEPTDTTFASSIANIRDIWSRSNVETRKRMKDQLTKLSSEMI